MSTENGAAIYEREVLIYRHDGTASTGRGPTYTTLMRAAYPTLCHAFKEAVREGYNPTHWTRGETGSPELRLDQADHWRAQMKEAGRL